MDKAELAAQLASGVSIEAIARAAGRDPSTVAYWVNKYGLVSTFAAKHAARGGIPRGELQELVVAGCTVRAIAEALGCGATTVRYWLKKHGLSTVRTIPSAPEERRRSSSGAVESMDTPSTCSARRGRRYRCRAVPDRAVSRVAEGSSALLVAEAGGRCMLCGYARYPGALQFHHVDPAARRSPRRCGRRDDRSRGPRRGPKCVLLCANCHAEVGGGNRYFVR